jgi:hypothetical protein
VLVLALLPVFAGYKLRFTDMAMRGYGDEFAGDGVNVRGTN